MTNSDLIVASSFPFLPDNLLGSSSFGKSTSCLSCWKNSTTLEEGSADFGLIPVTRRRIVTAAALLAARPLCRHNGNITGLIHRKWHGRSRKFLYYHLMPLIRIIYWLPCMVVQLWPAPISNVNQVPLIFTVQFRCPFPYIKFRDLRKAERCG